MSYEGHRNFLCANGHLWDEPENYGNEDCGPCPYCKAEIVWENAVDETNCDDIGIIPPDEWKKLLLTPEKFETCNLGHRHSVAEPTYRVPSKEEHKFMRHYLNNRTGTYERLMELPVKRILEE